ncbi:MAG: hypothetical protein ABFQ95_05770 [Pseudomonadota bacterium]
MAKKIEAVTANREGFQVLKSEQSLIFQKEILSNQELVGTVEGIIGKARLIKILSADSRYITLEDIEINETEAYGMKGRVGEGHPLQDGGAIHTEKSIHGKDKDGKESKAHILFESGVKTDPLLSQVKLIYTLHQPQSYTDFCAQHDKWYKVLALISFALFWFIFLIRRFLVSKELKMLRQEKSAALERNQYLQSELTKQMKIVQDISYQSNCWKSSAAAKEELLANLLRHSKQRADIINQSIRAICEESIGERNLSKKEYEQLLAISLQGTQDILLGTMGPRQTSRCLLTPLLNKCRDIFLGALCERNITFNDQCPEDLYIESDALALGTLVISLVHIAILRAKEHGSIEVTSVEQESNVILTVCDDGFALLESAYNYLSKKEIYFLNKQQIVSMSEKLGGACDFTKNGTGENMIQMKLPKKRIQEDAKVVQLFS